MDIEIELEILIDKHKGKQVGLGEIRLDWFAEDCLKEIRRLKSEIARQSVKSEEVQEAIGLLSGKSYGTHNLSCDCVFCKALDLAITALQQMRTPVEPILDHWAVCPECGYEYILEIMVDYATSDEWLVKYCPECGQPFKYDDQLKADLVAIRKEEVEK